MALSTLLDNWRANANMIANIATWRTFPARLAQTRSLPADLHAGLVAALQTQGIRTLYTHQAEAWQHIQAGQNPIIVTGTASGKTLCYNLPILNDLLRHPEARALYLFPTKALAQDQSEALRQLVTTIDHEAMTNDPKSPIANPSTSLRTALQSSIAIATYDGDTPASLRRTIRQNARVIISNPDMLHAGILPHHTRWAEFFQSLRFVVLDEMHVYRGVFGSHVANVLRRLKRIAQFYGASPQFILTSATIANPTEFAERLIEAPVSLVDDDGAAQGAKHFLIYNPPVVDQALGLRRSALQESVQIAQELLHHNVQTIVFGRTRRTVELLLGYLRDRATPAVTHLPGTSQNSEPDDPQAQANDLKDMIRAYRSGYLPRQRREIERGLREGRVRAVTATSALELGIDIGPMGAAVMAGYPGTVAGTWQQAGRAGRQQEASLAVLVVSANPLDQFLAHHPNYFFDRSPERALINPDNLLILLQHLRCAAFELPFRRGADFGRVDGATVAEFLDFLQATGELHQSGNKYFWMADHYPAEGVSLRSASPARVLLQAGLDDEPTIIGEVDLASAPWMVHPQAIYLHEGQSYLVEDLDLTQNVASLRPVRVDYYTEPRRETTVQLVEKTAETGVRGACKAYGEISVTTQVVGFQRVRWFTHERLDTGEVSLPASELQTTGYWLALEEATVGRLRAQGLWTNDPNDYGPNWQAQRRQARARDGYCCQLCGLPEQGHEHDVHHKIPFRTFASYKEANRLTNLITLCRSCHRLAETTVRMRSGLSGLAFALGYLAPFFLMCDFNDVAVHADPQSPWADGQPSVIIYDLAPGGIGFSERLYELHDELISRAYDVVSTCDCADGCPSCVGPAGEDGRGGKRETKAILEMLVLAVE